MKTIIWFRVSYLWLAGNEGMENTLEILYWIIYIYIGTKQ